MKEYYLLLFMGVTIVLIFCTLIIGKIHDPLVKYAQRLLNVAILAVMVRAVATMTASELTASIAFSIFFACIDWILLLLIDFCFIYTNSKKESLWYHILSAFVAFDSVTMLSNNLTGRVFDCYPVITAGGDFYYRTGQTPLFILHLILCYAMIVFILYLLIKTTVKSAKVYKAKYYPILLCLIVIVVWNGIYMFFERKIDTSVIGYAVLGVVLSYFALVYDPKDVSHNQ